MYYYRSQKKLELKKKKVITNRKQLTSIALYYTKPEAVNKKSAILYKTEIINKNCAVLNETGKS
jgi:hypothetical protein